ncbi:hypothetical protein [Halomonas sp. I5-271120]|uniref:hypothetical protein n=1 Tax=Halomonas sp. I5-271120 TaxID=3061632 RepID=UPI002714C65F|nr:hypothetical protein [Halomonas sp. I5-271120]
MRLTEQQLQAMGYAIKGDKAVPQLVAKAAPRAEQATSKASAAPKVPREESRPQRQLFELLTQSPVLGHLPWVWEHASPIPDRKFSVDIALELPRADGSTTFRGALECDGWNYHGRYLSGFKRDREKDRLLALNGWRVLRISAGEIMKSPWPLLEDIEQWLDIEVAGWRRQGEVS